MTPFAAYWYALDNHTKQNFDLKYYQEIACAHDHYAYWFAKNIPGADIEYCQEHACKSAMGATWFAKYIPGADIAYCRKACEYDKDWLNKFDKDIVEKAML